MKKEKQTDWLEAIVPLEKEKGRKRRSSPYRERKQEIHPTQRGKGKIQRLMEKLRG